MKNIDNRKDNNMKTTYFFTESNRRLGMKRNRRITFDTPDQYRYDVSGMESFFRNHIRPYVQYDSGITLKTIKIGNTYYQI